MTRRRRSTYAPPVPLASSPLFSRAGGGARSAPRLRSAAALIVQRVLPPPRRPFSDDELRSNAPQVVTCNDYQREVAVTQTIAGKQFDRVFTFDKV
nr:unnamed protein product [Digitaria exilis]